MILKIYTILLNIYNNIIINSNILKIAVASKYPPISDKAILATKIVLVLPFLNILSKLLSAINLNVSKNPAHNKIK
jgi:hypothetical protein